MERSGWFDDDDESTSQPPPEQRAWRHPSELGAHGPYGAPPARRRHGLRFAGALALGGAGTVAFVVLTSMHLFGAELGRVSSPFDNAQASLLTLPPRTLVASSTTVAVPVSQTVVTTAAPAATAPVRSVASMPPRVGLRVAGATTTVPAVVDDDGFVLTGTEDLAGATEAQVVLDDGTEVTATVDSIDEASGVARLKPATPVRPPAEQTMAWLGVTCADDRVPAATDPAPSTTTTAPPAATTTAPSSTIASATTALVTTSVVRPATTAATTTTAAPSTTGAADTRPRVVATTTPAATTVDTRATTVPSTAAAPADDTADDESTDADATAPSTTVAAVTTGVRVHAVHADSPAARSGVRTGDLILSVDGRPVHSRWALVLAIRRHAIGDLVELELLRDDVRMRIQVELAAGPTT